jgi:hypothetical protein
MTFGRSHLAIASLSLLAGLGVGCSDDTDADGLGVIAESFLDGLDRRGIDLETDDAADYIAWFCQNQVAPIEAIRERTRAAGAGDGVEAYEVLTAASSACRSAGKPTGY